MGSALKTAVNINGFNIQLMIYMINLHNFSIKAVVHIGVKYETKNENK